MGDRWPLRVRVALAFLGTTAIALVGLGFFVQLRVADTLDERLRDTLESEAQRLVATSPEQRSRLVEALQGENYAQLFADDGTLVSSSPLVSGRLVGDALVTGSVQSGDERYVETDVSLFDDDEQTTAQRAGDAETEPALLLVRPDGHQVIVVGTSRDDVEDAVGEVRDQFLIGGPIALLVAGALGYFVAGAGLRPIERMRARAATISDRNAGERLPLPQANDELRRLAATLNAMLDRLDEGLQHQRRFVAEASHELRTPLALMLTEVELALSRPRSPAELRLALQSTEEEIRRLIALAEDLLVLAAADSGSLRVDLRPLDLASLTRDVAERFEASARAGARAINVSAPYEVVVLGDHDRLDRVVSNLVDNALRHGAGDVAVAVTTDNGTARLVVTDHGPGFDQGRAFDRFSGSGASSGLGLAIVQEIVSAHGGSVDVFHDDAATSVGVTLPVG